MFTISLKTYDELLSLSLTSFCPSCITLCNQEFLFSRLHLWSFSLITNFILATLVWQWQFFSPSLSRKPFPWQWETHMISVLLSLLSNVKAQKSRKEDTDESMFTMMFTSSSIPLSFLPVFADGSRSESYSWRWERSDWTNFITKLCCQRRVCLFLLHYFLFSVSIWLRNQVLIVQLSLSCNSCFQRKW